MTVDNLLVILQKIIDISLVWMMVYFVLKNIKNNVKIILLFKIKYYKKGLEKLF